MCIAVGRGRALVGFHLRSAVGLEVDMSSGVCFGSVAVIWRVRRAGYCLCGLFRGLWDRGFRRWTVVVALSGVRRAGGILGSIYLRLGLSVGIWELRSGMFLRGWRLSNLMVVLRGVG